MFTYNMLAIKGNYILFTVDHLYCSNKPQIFKAVTPASQEQESEATTGSLRTD